MATDPSAAPGTAPTWSSSAIENELPTYRAISLWAVGSLVLGVISGVTFASLGFLVASALAIATGAFALRTIRREPDRYTGAGLANVGIALGLMTGLAAPTYTVVQRTIIGRQANAYAEALCEAMREGGFPQALWYSSVPTARQQATADQMVEELQAQSESEPMPNPRVVALRAITDRLESSDEQHIHVEGIENRGYDGITPFAGILLRIDGPNPAGVPTTEFAMLLVKGIDSDAHREWFVEEIQYPYERGSETQVVESAHGHDH